MNMYEIMPIFFALLMVAAMIYVGWIVYTNEKACSNVNMFVAAQEDVPSGYVKCVTVENETLKYKIMNR